MIWERAQMKIGALVLMGCAVASPALAAQYLDTVRSDVFTASGDQASLARRAAVCLARESGVPGAPVQTDAEAGLAVGHALFGYSGSLGIPWSVKSTVTVETKDGRFRITHTALVQKQGGPATHSFTIFNGSLDEREQGGWLRVGLWAGSGGRKVEAAAQSLSSKIASCIQSPADNW